MTDKSTYRRRCKIADIVQEKLGLNRLGDNLYGGIKERFSNLLSHGAADQFLADQPMWRVPYFVIAKAMVDAMPMHHVIDHAWWLIAQDQKGICHEPWGFVTEPYLDLPAATVVQQLNFSEWGVDIEILPKELSAWNPGSTIPIVVTIRSGCLSAFLKRGVSAALELL